VVLAQVSIGKQSWQVRLPRWGVVLPQNQLGGVTTTGSTAPQIGFQSDYTDATSGDSFMGARWYSSTRGSFDSRDTYAGKLTSPLSQNRYLYGEDNARSAFDANGHSNFLSDGWDSATSYASDAWDSATSYVSDAWSTVTSWASTAWNTVTSGASAVYNYGKRAVGSAFHAAQRAYSSITHAASSAYHRAATAFSRAKTEFVSKAQGVAKFISDHANVILPALAGIVVGGVCLAATAGAGSVGCLALAGAAAGGVAGGMRHCGDGHSAQECATGIASYAAVGALSGAGAAVATGGLAAGMVGAGLGDSVVAGALSLGSEAESAAPSIRPVSSSSRRATSIPVRSAWPSGPVSSSASLAARPSVRRPTASSR
jgi:RHS repeat-associated protein